MNNQYLFNSRYYDSLYSKNGIDETVTEANNKLKNFRLGNTAGIPDYKNIKNYYSITMKTVYPGLLIGIGNPHSSGMSTEEIKLGFSLDYTTGLPYIPGSTVKGVFRSVFKKPEITDKASEKDKAIKKENYRSRLEYLKETISEICELDQSGFKVTDEMIANLETEMFGSSSDGKGDLFLDAYPVCGDSDQRLFAFESITPHDELFKNPTPLRLLKVRPEVVYEFGFSLRDSTVIPALTAEKKKKLFTAIITLSGMGAKSNVGFGMMTEVEKPVRKPAVKPKPVSLPKKENNKSEKGHITFLNSEKGFGFIETKQHKKVFFHCSKCKGTDFKDLNVRDEVECEVIQAENRFKAKFVRLI